MKFSELKTGQSFIDPKYPNDVCIKTSAGGAKDPYCAKGFELSFGPNDTVYPL